MSIFNLFKSKKIVKKNFGIKFIIGSIILRMEVLDIFKLYQLDCQKRLIRLGQVIDMK